MPRFQDHKILPYTPQQMYDLVIDIKKYPEFLPWCVSSQVRQKNEQEIVASLTIGYQLLHETFLSRVTFDSAKWIKVHYIRGPFKHLDNEWQFIQHGENACEVLFYVDFEFNVGLFNNIANRMFFEISQKMVRAFEDRALQLYGVSQEGEFTKIR